MRLLPPSLRRPLIVDKAIDHHAVFLEFALSLLCLLGERQGVRPRGQRGLSRLRVVK